MLNVGLEQQQRIMGADGTILWSGAQVVADSAIIQVAAAGTTIKMGDAVQWDATNSVLPRPETTAQGVSPAADLPMSLAMFGNISPAAANAPNLIGVAQEPIAAGKRGLVATSGSLVCVKVGNAGPPNTTIAIGSLVGSFTIAAGAVAIIVVGSVLNNVLGAVFKINQVAAPGTGSLDWVGIQVGKGGSAAVS